MTAGVAMTVEVQEAILAAARLDVESPHPSAKARKIAAATGLAFSTIEGVLRVGKAIERTRSDKREQPPARTAEYYVWYHMRLRCHDPLHPDYGFYGERGIVVCQRWRESFDAFLADVGRRPTAKHSIDRIDNDGPYSPENCRWADRKTQARNRTGRRMLTVGEATKPLWQWAEETGIPVTLISARIHRLGWSVEDAVTRPVTAQPRASRVTASPQEIQLLYDRLGDWCLVAENLGVSDMTLRKVRRRNEAYVDARQGKPVHALGYSAAYLNSLFVECGSWEAVADRLGIGKERLIAIRRRLKMPLKRWRDRNVAT